LHHRKQVVRLHQPRVAQQSVGQGLPSSKEQGDNHHRLNNHRAVLSHEEQREFERAVLSEDSCDEFRLCFNHVKGSAAGFCEGCDDVQHTSNGHHEDAPARKDAEPSGRTLCSLGSDHLIEICGPIDQERRNDGEAHGDLVGDH
jgi:hypothetical protein